MAEVLEGAGSVKLVGHYGDDLTIVNSARQSVNRESREMSDADVGLLRRLMRDRHGTPFEMVDFTFDVYAPIFVAREWMRHRMASYNELSGRYTKLLQGCYIPKVHHIRRQKGKGMSYEYEPLPKAAAEAAQDVIVDAARRSWADYTQLLTMGVAKEQARIVLPVSTMTRFRFKTNLRSLLNFFSLRSHETAMFEIREYSKAMERLVWPVVPHTMSWFIECGRVAP